MQSVKLLMAVTVLQCSGCDGAVGLLSSRNAFTVEPLTNHLTDECTLYRWRKEEEKHNLLNLTFILGLDR